RFNSNLHELFPTIIDREFLSQANLTQFRLKVLRYADVVNRRCEHTNATHGYTHCIRKLSAADCANLDARRNR
ncbi:MAG: hypothetical protein ACXW6K_19210, partial [Candidatus Binatia bacterium]